MLSTKPVQLRLITAVSCWLCSGWNVIDTASNYRGGRGEKAVGYALAALRNQPGLTREMLFISSKAGFLQDTVRERVNLLAIVLSSYLHKFSAKGAILCLDITLDSSGL